MVILTGELVFVSRVSAAVISAGKVCRVALSAAKALDLLTEQPDSLICVDLSAPGVSIDELVLKLRTANAGQTLRIVAYAPHVHEAKLAAASAAGCDLVLTRGQFDRSLAELAASA